METYNGFIKTQLDAILLFEACRLGILSRVQRRLSERERLQIKSGSIYVWNEAETGMKRWTDGKPWSASRVSGSFLTYREMENGRRSVSPPATNNSRTSIKSSPPTEKRKKTGTGPNEGLQYKIGGLYKQSFSLVTSDGMKFHLISYYKKEDIQNRLLTQPTQDPKLKSLNIPIDFYPDNTSAGNNLGPAVIRGPMTSAPLPPPHQSPTAAAASTINSTANDINAAAASQHQYLSTSASPPNRLSLPPPPPHQQQPQQHQHQQQQPQFQSPPTPFSPPSSHSRQAPLPPPPSSHPPTFSYHRHNSSASSSYDKYNLPPVTFPSPPSSATSNSSASNREPDANAEVVNSRDYVNTEDRRAIQRLDRGFMV